MKIRLNRRLIQAGICLLAALALLPVGVLAHRLWVEGRARVGTQPVQQAEQPPADAQPNGLVQYRGESYLPREGLKTVLLIGVDKYLKDELSQRVHGEFEQSDFLLLLVIDPEEEMCTAVHINRDSMVKYWALSDAGRKLTELTGQITLAHTYGGESRLRCRNTVEAVSGLLYGVPVDHYIELGMDGIVVLNDLAGGVTVEVLDDFSNVDETLVQGQTVTLRGEQALTYVRERKDLEDSSNLHRMERQRQYLEALQNQLLARAAANANFAADSLLEVNEYMESDCTIQQLSELMELLGDFGVREYRTLAGEAVEENGSVAYYVDTGALEALVMELFYQPQA